MKQLPPKLHKIIEIARGQTSRLIFEKDQYIDVDYEWMNKHKPKRGGFYVQYPDGTATYMELGNGK